jgi:hypothetical protein
MDLRSLLTYNQTTIGDLLHSAKPPIRSGDMPRSVTLTEETVQRWAPDDQVLQAGRDLVRTKSFLNPATATDGTWLMAQCKGSGKTPYEMSVDVWVESAPVGRCTCPSRKLPCKHCIGLMFLYLEKPESFGEREPSADLLAKREKATAKAKKKTTADGEGEDSGSAKPPKVNLRALAKKMQAQKDGLDLLEKLLIDLVAGGQWYEKSRLERLERQAKQMSDSYLPGALRKLRELVIIGRDSSTSEEDRTDRAIDVIAHLWATVLKGRNYLADKLSDDENQTEADAVMEEVLGKAWLLTELFEKGYTRKNLKLYELAYERFPDEARDERVEMSHLLEMGDGSMFQAIQYTPRKAAKTNPRTQPSFMQPVAVTEAAVYPGFINRRVRWEPAAESVQPMDEKVLKAVYGKAVPLFETAINAFKQQLKNPLAPREAVFFLKCQMVAKIGERVVVEDAKGDRIECVDRRKDYSNVDNLRRAGGELRKQPALCARLFVQPSINRRDPDEPFDKIVADPLALLQPEKHLRLGL